VYVATVTGDILGNGTSVAVALRGIVGLRGIIVGLSGIAVGPKSPMVGLRGIIVGLVR
jgi:hypothetical protein